jgi:hypothetical protein
MGNENNIYHLPMASKIGGSCHTMRNKIKFMAWHLLLSLRRWLRLDEAMGKDELLSALKEERAHLRAMLAKLDDAQMVTPGVQGNWSVKDILTHISVWDRRGTRWVKTATEGQMPEIPGPGLNRQDFDRLNHQTYLENRGRPLAEVMEEFNESYGELCEQVEALSEGVAGRPIMGELISWRYKHSRRHRGHIREWLDDLTSREGEAVLYPK